MYQTIKKQPAGMKTIRVNPYFLFSGLTLKRFDGWNLVQESTASYTANSEPQTINYIWGLDLSGSIQGAGGVGGLLATMQDGKTYHTAFDGNGNVMECVSAEGSIVAHYEYSPFGETIIQSGGKADRFAFRFSTKYSECLATSTELYYYGRRFYSPGIGRWLNHDPLEEPGGFNLYGFVYNAPVCFIDRNGLDTVTVTTTTTTVNVSKPPAFVGGPLTSKHFEQLKEKLKADLQAMCPETATELRAGYGCCYPEDCKSEAAQMAEVYITELERAYRMRTVSPGYKGNGEIEKLFGSGNYPNSLYPGLVCSGWSEMARIMITSIIGNFRDRDSSFIIKAKGGSACWEFLTKSSNYNAVVSKLRSLFGMENTRHQWSVIGLIGSEDGINLDPFYSGGWTY